jgi:hypothetical protein
MAVHIMHLAAHLKKSWLLLNLCFPKNTERNRVIIQIENRASYGRVKKKHGGANLFDRGRKERYLAEEKKKVGDKWKM